MQQELIIPYELKLFLNDIVESRYGYKLGDPWKYSEEALGVVVPILREMAPDRTYVTMYEVLDQLNIKDTGHINQVELQNNCGKAIFVRAGTIFTGKTQNRASQHSGVYQEKNTNINVNCVYQTHGIRQGEEMKFGDISPPSITFNLMTGNQSKVWESVHRFTSGSVVGGEHSERRTTHPTEREHAVGSGATNERSGVGSSNYNQNFRVNNFTTSISDSTSSGTTYSTTTASSTSSENLKKAYESIQRYNNWSGVNCEINSTKDGNVRISRVKPSCEVTRIWRGTLSEKEVDELSKFANNITSQYRESRTRTYGFFDPCGSSSNYISEISSDNLFEHLQKIKGQSLLDDMMQKVPLFANQVGAIIFNPVGVIALETFDHPISWSSIKKEIIEKYGDKIKNQQAEHLFELKPEMILPSLRKFINNLDRYAEKTIRKDNFSETREVRGEGVIGEYTLVNGQPIHVLLLRNQ